MVESKRFSNQKGIPWKSIHLVIPFFRRHKLRIATGFLSLAAVDFLQLWIPRIIKSAVDSLQWGTATEKNLLWSSGTIIMLALTIALFRFCWRYLVLGFSRILERDLRNWMFDHLLRLDRPFYSRHPTGEVMALATNDLMSVQLSCGMGLVAFVDAIIMSIAAIGFMVMLHPLLTLIAVSPIPILAIATRVLARHLHHRFKRVQEQFSKLTEFARTTISSIRLIKAYCQEDFQTKQFDAMGRAYVEDNIRLAFVQGTLFPFSGLVANVSMLFVLFWGGRMAIRGQITLGDFAAFIAYLMMLTWPMMALGWVANLFQRGITSLNRIETLLNQEPILKENPGAVKLSSVRGFIHIAELTFAYPRSRNPVLNGVNLDLEPGKILGIVGPTGSGKSTLCHLLARFYPVDDGMIFLDGYDVNQVSLSTIRSAIAMVPQNVVLFSDTIAANIAMGRPDAEQEAIEHAARAAAVHDEIVALRDGYQSRIGERGVKLSGGQRQRIALARALLLNRPILIIDDGLSAVDTETEHAIVRSLHSFLIDRTCIIVSHRIAPLADAHEIAVLERGRIVAQGSHQQLLERNRFYNAIYRHQTLIGQCGS